MLIFGDFEAIGREECFRPLNQPERVSGLLI